MAGGTGPPGTLTPGDQMASGGYQGSGEPGASQKLVDQGPDGDSAGEPGHALTEFRGLRITLEQCRTEQMVVISQDAQAGKDRDQLVVGESSGWPDAPRVKMTVLHQNRFTGPEGSKHFRRDELRVFPGDYD